MRVVTRQELMALPNGTIYHEWEPCFWRQMAVKVEDAPGIAADWYQAMIPQMACHNSAEEADAHFAMGDGASVALDLESAGREALYDDKLRYAVWEHADLVALAAVVQRAIDVAKPVA